MTVFMFFSPQRILPFLMKKRQGIHTRKTLSVVCVVVEHENAVAVTVNFWTQL
jgi:hypothetical protein